MNFNCHCGNISITSEKEPETITRCNCSICNRYGAMWSYFTPEKLTIDIGALGSKSYSWGDKNINFIFCHSCGCITHYETTEKVTPKKIGVNTRMAPIESTRNIRIRDFDGADSWEYID